MLGNPKDEPESARCRGLQDLSPTQLVDISALFGEARPRTRQEHGYDCAGWTVDTVDCQMRHPAHRSRTSSTTARRGVLRCSR